MRVRGWIRAALVVSAVVGPALRAQEPAGPDLRVSQDTTIVDEVTLRDGTTLIGWIVRIVGDSVTIRTHRGLELMVLRREVVSVRRLRGAVRHGQVWPDDASDSRLFLGPTARVPENGGGYFGLYELIFASGAVGLGGQAMVSGGVSLVPGVALDEQVFYIAPKVRLVNLPTLQVAAGGFWIKPGSSDDGAGLIFGTLTGGSRDAAITVTAGFPFVTQGGFEEQPLVMVGGELRIARDLKFISENWILPGEDVSLVSAGLRIITRSLTVEVGAVTSTDGGGFLPIVSFSVVW
jgi:hypothetical protein